jgi:hypothetical protein
MITKKEDEMKMENEFISIRDVWLSGMGVTTQPQNPGF